MMSEETLRIRTMTRGEVVPGLYLRVSGPGDPKASETLERLKETMLLFAESSQSPRLTDEEWKRRLPTWLHASFEQEVTWSFPVWLDFMIDRTWEWWSSELYPNSWTVNIMLDDLPNSSDAFLWMAEAARGSDQIEDEIVSVS